MRNDEIAQKLREFHECLDGHARASSAERDAIRRDLAEIREEQAIINTRLDGIDAKLETLGKIEPTVETLKEVAAAYELAGTAGRALKWLAGFLAAAAAAYAAVKGWFFPSPGGGQ